MLANIAKQIRDIGLRVAIGATRLRRIWLYLWHAVLLSLSSSLWGVATGMDLSMLSTLRRLGNCL